MKKKELLKVADILNDLFGLEESDVDYLFEDTENLQDEIEECLYELEEDDKETVGEDWHLITAAMRELMDEEALPEWAEEVAKEEEKPKKTKRRKRKESKKTTKKTPEDRDEEEPPEENEKPKKKGKKSGKKGKGKKTTKKTPEDEKPKKRGRKAGTFSLTTKNFTRPVAIGVALADADDVSDHLGIIEAANNMYVEEGKKDSVIDMRMILQGTYQVLTTLYRENPDAFEEMIEIVKNAVSED